MTETFKLVKDFKPDKFETRHIMITPNIDGTETIMKYVFREEVIFCYDLETKQTEQEKTRQQ